MKESAIDKTVLVIGGGKHGAKACRHFREQKARVVLVDKDPQCPGREFVPRESFVLDDAKNAWELALSVKPDLIIPAHPGHTVGKWLGEYLHLDPLPDSMSGVLMRLPQSMILDCDEHNGMLTSSYMTRGEMCSGSCLPYPDRCTVTGEPRPVPLYRLMEYAISGLFDCGRIFASEQMAEGVGAIRASDFLAFVEEIETRRPKTLAVGTACHCHGIMNLFKERNR